MTLREQMAGLTAALDRVKDAPGASEASDLASAVITRR